MTVRFGSWKRRYRELTRTRRARRDLRRALRLESLETRSLLAANLASVTGTAFIDLTDDGLTVDDAPLANATIRLYRDGGDAVLDRGSGDDTLVGSQTTDASGHYRFDDLEEGLYFLEQLPVAGVLQRPGENVHSFVITATEAQGDKGVLIDPFNVTTQKLDVSSAVPTTDASTQLAPESLGGERDLFVELQSAPGAVELEVNLLGLGLLTFSNKLGAVGRGTVTWDGLDNNGSVLDPVGLGGVDLTEGGANIGIRLLLGADLPGGSATLRVYTDAGNYSSYQLPIPQTPSSTAEDEVILRFGDFIPAAGSGAAFTNVGAVQMEIQGVSNLDAEFKELGTIGPTLKVADFVNLDPLSIGDTVWLDVNNNGLLDTGEAGIPGVALTLYEDTDGNGVFTPAIDQALATTTTDSTGRYRFDDLLPGDYLVQVDSSNFMIGGVLFGRVSSTGNDPAPDPDDDVDNDDNGYALEGYGVVTRAVTLTAGGEPVADGDEDPNTNLTVDFGFTVIADLVIIKSDDPDPVVAGESLTYTLEVRNLGPSTATGVVVTDTLPAGVQFTSLTTTQGSGSHAGGVVTVELGALESGENATITIVVLVLPSTTGPLLNEASVTSETFDPVDPNNRDDEPTEVTPQIDLAIQKTDTPDPVLAGQALTYTLTVTNLGPSNATGVRVEDVLPAGVTYVSATTSQGAVNAVGGTVTAELGDLAAEAEATITILVDVAASARGTLVNTATVSGNEPETNLENNEDQASTTVNALIDLTMEKDASGEIAIPGQPLTYTLIVGNSGPSDATGVQVVDTLPPGVTYVSATTSQGTVSGSGNSVTALLGSLAVGEQATITILVDVDGTASGTLVNTSTVSGVETETNLENNTDEASVVVQPQVDVAIFKVDSPDPAVAGQPLTYTLSVVNNGPSAATGVIVTDTLPAGLTYQSATASQGTVSLSGNTVTANLGTLPSGATQTVTIVTIVDADTRGTLHNTATVTTNEDDTNPQNNHDEEPTDVRAEVDLAIVKTDSPDPISPGQQLTYTLTVTNNGPSLATGVTVTDTLPAGVTYQSATASQGNVGHAGNTVTGELGSLASGATATITILVIVDPTTRGVITNSATVTANETDTNPDNNHDDEPTQVRAEVDLVIVKTDSPDPVVAGQALTYTLTVTNNGPSDATGVIVTDTLPAGVTYQSATSSQGAVSQTGGIVTATLGSLADGATATITILVTVNPATRGEIVNVATVTGNEVELKPDNNSDEEPTQVQAQADLTLTKTDSPDPAVAGGSLTYTLVVTNNGPSRATGVTVTDVLPSGLTYVSGSSTAGSVSQASGTVTATVGDLAVGQTATITLVTQIDAQFSGTLDNEASVAGNEPDPKPDNNTAREPTTISEMLSSISGLVYVDANNNGLREAHELPIVGVVIVLTGTDSSGAPVERQTTTAADGTFRFENLRRGTYQLTEQQPAEYRDGKETVGSLPANADVNDTFSDIHLPAGVAAIDYLFGERTVTFSKRRFLSSVQ